MSREIELLTEIRDLLQVMAEPNLAKRDAKMRVALRDVVGSSNIRPRDVIQPTNGGKALTRLYDVGLRSACWLRLWLWRNRRGWHWLGYLNRGSLRLTASICSRGHCRVRSRLRR